MNNGSGGWGRSFGGTSPKESGNLRSLLRVLCYINHPALLSKRFHSQTEFVWKHGNNFSLLHGRELIRKVIFSFHLPIFILTSPVTAVIINQVLIFINLVNERPSYLGNNHPPSRPMFNHISSNSRERSLTLFTSHHEKVRWHQGVTRWIAHVEKSGLHVWTVFVLFFWFHCTWR